MNLSLLSSLLVQLLALNANAKTIIRIKHPQSEAINGNYGMRAFGSTNDAKHAKRDLSLSYSATNIDSKEGTRIKTVTVIKNVGGSNGGSGAAGGVGGSSANDKLAINPDEYKGEEWATVFRDNFESFDDLPDVPDIDELFEFVSKKKTSSGKDADKHEEKKPEKPKATPKAEKEQPSNQPKELEKEVTTTTKKPTVEKNDGKHDVTVEKDEGTVEKIQGDAELLPETKEKRMLRTQFLTNALRTREPLVNVNYSTAKHSVHQYFDNYVQELPNGYDYVKPKTAYPCAPPGSSSSSNVKTVTTNSGRTYDIPLGNSSGSSGGNPYLAPAVSKKSQSATPQPQPTQLVNIPQPPLSVNSILPPLQTQPATIGQVPQSAVNNLAPQAPSSTLLPPLQIQQNAAGAGAAAAATGTQPNSLVGGAGFSTSQRPYLAPSLRNGLGLNRGPPQTPGYRNDDAALQSPGYRTNIFSGVTNRPNTFRSRGLKY